VFDRFQIDQLHSKTVFFGVFAAPLCCRSALLTALEMAAGSPGGSVVASVMLRRHEKYVRRHVYMCDR
jgi:hypothetical protein